MAYETTIIGREGYMDGAGAYVDTLVKARADDPDTGLFGYGEADTEEEATANSVISLELALREKADFEAAQAQAALTAERDAELFQEFMAWRSRQGL
jgi:hypothetical protein